MTPQSKRAAGKHLRTAETAVSEKGSRSAVERRLGPRLQVGPGGHQPPPHRERNEERRTRGTRDRAEIVTIRPVQAAVAAGHPATVEAGLEILEDGGSAADAAVAASLATCVAETVMTGLLGGGHGIYFDAPTGRARTLDCFVAIPGLGREPRHAELLELDIVFGNALVHYSVGIASCGVPGLPAGLAELHREHGRLPWRRLVEPALRLAADGVDFPPAHAACLAMLEPVMTMNEGARIYAPEGELLPAGAQLVQPGLVPALELVAEEGPRSAYEGTLGEALLELMDERDGLVTRADLDRVRSPLVGSRRSRLRREALPDARRALRPRGAARRAPATAWAPSRRPRPRARPHARRP